MTSSFRNEDSSQDTSGAGAGQSGGRHLPALVATATLSSTGIPTEAAAYVADHHSWDLVCTLHGYKLTSQHPVIRFVGAGAALSITEERETLFLHKNCEATLSTLGKGQWCISNAGFYARFDGHCMEFRRQDLVCPDGSLPEYALYCSCGSAGEHGGPPVGGDPLCNTPQQLIDRYKLESPN